MIKNFVPFWILNVRRANNQVIKMEKSVIRCDSSDKCKRTGGIRANQLNLKEPFPGAVNQLDWLDEQANMRKEKNFFETRVTEYQTGVALNW